MSRGFMPAGLASTIAAFVAMSPWRRIARRLDGDGVGRSPAGARRRGPWRQRVDGQGTDIGKEVHGSVLWGRAPLAPPARGLNVASRSALAPATARDDLQREAVGHAGDIVGDDARQFGLARRFLHVLAPLFAATDRYGP